MLKKIKTLIVAAALSGTVSATAQAATLNDGDSLQTKGQWNYLITDRLGTDMEKAEKAQAMDYHMNVLQMKDWDNLITDFIHPHSNLEDLNTAVTVTNDKPAVPVAVAPSPVVSVVPTATKLGLAPAKPEVASEPAPAPAPVEEAAPAAPAPVQAEPAPAPAPEPAAQPAPAPEKTEPAPAPSNKVITVKATAYTASCEGCSGITATGVNIKDNPNEKVIAVDPKVIPLGSKVYVEGVGEMTAADTGGAIKGNRIDVFIPTEQEAIKFGVKQLKVTIIN